MPYHFHQFAFRQFGSWEGRARHAFNAFTYVYIRNWKDNILKEIDFCQPLRQEAA